MASPSRPLLRVAFGLAAVAVIGAAAWALLGSGAQQAGERQSEGRQVKDQAIVDTNEGLDPAEKLARIAASQGIEAQQPEVKRRYYEAHLMTGEEALGTLNQLIEDLTQARLALGKGADADSARMQIDKQIEAARTQHRARADRVEELKDKLASVR